MATRTYWLDQQTKPTNQTNKVTFAILSSAFNLYNSFVQTQCLVRLFSFPLSSCMLFFSIFPHFQPVHQVRSVLFCMKVTVGSFASTVSPSPPSNANNKSVDPMKMPLQDLSSSFGSPVARAAFRWRLLNDRPAFLASFNQIFDTSIGYLLLGLFL